MCVAILRAKLFKRGVGSLKFLISIPDPCPAPMIRNAWDGD